MSKKTLISIFVVIGLFSMTLVAVPIIGSANDHDHDHDHGDHDDHNHGDHSDSAMFLPGESSINTAPMNPGETRTIRITMQNNGETTWNNHHGLLPAGSQNWGVLSPVPIPFPHAVVPMGADLYTPSKTTFEFTITAPQQPGNYTLSFQMYHDGFFGQASTPVTIQVVGATHDDHDDHNHQDDDNHDDHNHNDDQTTMTHPRVTLNTNTKQIQSGQSVTLSWNVSGTFSHCWHLQGTPTWASSHIKLRSPDRSASQVISDITQTTSFGVKCSQTPTGSNFIHDEDWVTIQVQPAPTPPPSPVCSAGAINRAQGARLLVTVRNHPIQTAGSPYFSDVPATHPDYGPIQTIKSRGLTSGIGAGLYGPDHAMTRGAYVVFAVRDRGLQLINPATPSFSDVPISHGFYQYIETAKHYRLISAYADGTFRPHSTITGSEACAISNAIPTTSAATPTPTPAPTSTPTPSPTVNPTPTPTPSPIPTPDDDDHDHDHDDHDDHNHDNHDDHDHHTGHTTHNGHNNHASHDDHNHASHDNHSNHDDHSDHAGHDNHDNHNDHNSHASHDNHSNHDDHSNHDSHNSHASQDNHSDHSNHNHSQGTVYLALDTHDDHNHDNHNDHSNHSTHDDHSNHDDHDNHDDHGHADHESHDDHDHHEPLLQTAGQIQTGPGARHILVTTLLTSLCITSLYASYTRTNIFLKRHSRSVSKKHRCDIDRFNFA